MLFSRRTKKITYALTKAKLYVPAVTLPTQDNAKLLQQLKSSFKRMINQNRHLQLKKLKEIDI